MNTALKEQIAPEIVQAIIAKATARGLSVNDYLRQELGLTSGNGAELTVDEGAAPQRNEAMLAALQESEQILNDMPVRGSTEETLKMIRRARAGEMWGYAQPTQTQSNAGAGR